jgi:hypothetical protein
MTPEQRAMFVESCLIIWDLLASYPGGEGAAEHAKSLRAHAGDLDDDLVIREVDRVFRVTAGELVTMGVHLRTAVEMGSNYGARFQAVQADAATAANVTRKQAKAERARGLRDEDLTIAQIAVKMGVQPRTVERYLAGNKPPSARRPVRPHDDQPG